ncbi:uncharacterized protein LOC62_03G003540 [Vanrija pseudolonga]|uniref:Uncharacterized protein n=1 Tax=Vanrija pseudolonga TaxID=143232 RepID=A0AAF0Y957_9TREE|nr:hypothetical protein LOC62_03G003540 [Vanrija pseudolonga]
MGNILSCFPLFPAFAPFTLSHRPKPTLRELVANPETCPGVHGINHAHTHTEGHHSVSSLRCCCKDLPAHLDFDDAPVGAGVQWDFLLRRSPTRPNRDTFEYQASQYTTYEPKDEGTIRAEDHYQEIFEVHRSALYSHLLEHRLTCTAHRVHQEGSLEGGGVSTEEGYTGRDGGESEVAEHDPEYWDTAIVVAGGPRRRVMLTRRPPGGFQPRHGAEYW